MRGPDEALLVSDLRADASPKSLRNNSVLLALTLSGNRIGPSGGVALADALRPPSALHTLDLGRNTWIGQVSVSWGWDYSPARWQLLEDWGSGFRAEAL